MFTVIASCWPLPIIIFSSTSVDAKRSSSCTVCLGFVYFFLAICISSFLYYSDCCFFLQVFHSMFNCSFLLTCQCKWAPLQWLFSCMHYLPAFSVHDVYSSSCHSYSFLASEFLLSVVTTRTAFLSCFAHVMQSQLCYFRTIFSSFISLENPTHITCFSSFAFSIVWQIDFFFIMKYKFSSSFFDNIWKRSIKFKA